MIGRAVAGRPFDRDLGPGQAVRIMTGAVMPGGADTVVLQEVARVVDEDTGAVRTTEGGTVPGLYAAGRAAVGICSNSYVSGLSVADAIFSGRRAGVAAAAAVQTADR